MMKFARTGLVGLTTALSLTLTACGGGGDTGPQWAQDVNTLTTELLSQNIGSGNPQELGLRYVSDCAVFAGSLYEQTTFTITQTSTANQYLRAESTKYYFDDQCREANREFTVNWSSAVVVVEGNVTLATGETVQRVTVVSESKQPELIPGLATISGEFAELSIAEGAFLGPFSFVNGSVNKDIQLFTDTTVTYGDPSQSTAESYPTELGTNVYTLQTIVPGSTTN
jgi:hypothetical protein